MRSRLNGLMLAISLSWFAGAAVAAETVTRENFTRAQTDLMFRDVSALAGGVNRFHVIRGPTPLDQQTIMRMNLDTLYSGAIIDTAKGATITVPPMPDGRYASVLLIDNDHYAAGVLYEPGRHEIKADTRYVLAAVRIQVFNPADAKEIALVNSLQDKFVIEAESAEPLPPFNWNRDSLGKLRAELEAGSRRFENWEGAMGGRGQVDQEKHLYATATAWGLFPEQHATYLFYTGPDDGAACHTATYQVPKHQAFWSITMYGAKGYIEYENAIINSSNVALNEDGSFTAFFGSKEACGDVPNRLDTPAGWNFMMRIYRPDPSVLRGGYQLPPVVPFSRKD